MDYTTSKYGDENGLTFHLTSGLNYLESLLMRESRPEDELLSVAGFSTRAIEPSNGHDNLKYLSGAAHPGAFLHRQYFDKVGIGSSVHRVVRPSADVQSGSPTTTRHNPGDNDSERELHIFPHPIRLTVFGQFCSN
jgi:hypothetical protein